MKWEMFCLHKENLSLFPYENFILLFLESLMSQNHAPSRIVKLLAGISFFCRLQNMPACNSYFSVKQTLKSYRRERYIPDDTRPISLETLEKICLSTASICFFQFLSITF